MLSAAYRPFMLNVVVLRVVMLSVLLIVYGNFSDCLNVKYYTL
jgi:hypothetical protein